MKSKPNNKCPHHKTGPITWRVISTFAPPGPIDTEVGFPPTIAETSISAGGLRTPRVIEFQGSAVEEVYTAIPHCINTQEEWTPASPCGSPSHQSSLLIHGQEMQGLVWPPHIPGSSQQQSAKPSSVPGLLHHLFPRFYLQWCQE